jgi:hypothetical protein
MENLEKGTYGKGDRVTYSLLGTGAATAENVVGQAGGLGPGAVMFHRCAPEPESARGSRGRPPEGDCRGVGLVARGGWPGVPSPMMIGAAARPGGPGPGGRRDAGPLSLSLACGRARPSSVELQ